MVKIPISIFSSPLSPAEAVVSYMKEHKELSYAEIARKLNRDQRGIWCTHNRAMKKNAYLMTESEHHIDTIRLQNRGLSILENVVMRLKEQKLSNKRIAEIVNKKANTIGAVCHRIKRKNLK